MSNKYNFSYATFIIILVSASFNTIFSGEYHLECKDKDIEIVHDYLTGSLKKRLTQNILISPGNNNKLFVCYSGCRLVERWEGNVGYLVKPYKEKKTNILTEIDLDTKIEHQFNQPNEIDNEYPVTDIARQQDQYYVAHRDNVYAYQRTNGNYFNSTQLACKWHYTCNLPKDDFVKKIFVESDGNAIAVSSQGCIFKILYHDAQTTQSEPTKIPLTLLYKPSINEKISSFGYSAKNRMVLLGYTGFLKIIIFTPYVKEFHVPIKEDLTINLIETNDSHILLSNLLSNPLQTPKEQENLRYTIRYPKYKEKQCKNCDIDLADWRKKHEAWLNKPSIKEVRITPKMMQEKSSLFEDEPQKPNRCSHMHDINIILLPLDELIQQILLPSNKKILSPFSSQQQLTYSQQHWNIINTVLLDNDFLLIEHSGEEYSGNYTKLITQIPLKNIDTCCLKAALTPHNDPLYAKLPEDTFYGSCFSSSFITQQDRVIRTRIRQFYLATNPTNQEAYYNKSIHSVASYKKEKTPDSRKLWKIKLLRKYVQTKKAILSFHYKKTLQFMITSMICFNLFMYVTYRLALYFGCLPPLEKT